MLFSVACRFSDVAVPDLNDMIGCKTRKYPSYFQYLSFVTVRCRLTLYVFQDKNNHYLKKKMHSRHRHGAAVINMTAILAYLAKCDNLKEE